jgi:hypothetical protein
MPARRIFDGLQSRRETEQDMGDLLSLRIHHALNLDCAAGPMFRCRAAFTE